MALTFTKHQKIALRRHPDFSEAWLHDRICDDTSLLCLGELDVMERERSQYSGGRLDLLLGDGDYTRYEVEIMLGATAPSHIIRCIEYWDVERRRYPAYDHVAVLVAEEVTSRFLNVMSLLAGSIPLVAIQLNALQVGEHVVLDFVKVLDQRALRVDDDTEAGGEDVDRNSWESRVGKSSLAICDRMVEIANENGDGKYELKYKKRHLAITPGGSFFNVLVFYLRKAFVRVQAALENAAEWHSRLEDAGITASLVRGGTRVRFNLHEADVGEHHELLRAFIRDSVEQHRT